MDQTGELRKFMFIFKKRLALIVAITLIAVLTGAGLNFYVFVPVYKSSAVLMVNQIRNKDKQAIQYDDVLLNQKLVGAYVRVVKSKKVLRQTMDAYGYDKDFEEFSKKVIVTPMKDTGMIEIAVLDKDPRLAMRMANHISYVFMKEIEGIMNLNNIQLIDAAEVEPKPFKPRKLLNTIIAGLFGGSFAVMLAFMLEYLDNTLKTSHDIRRRLGLNVIGVVPDFGKLSEHIMDESSKSPVAEAYRSIRTSLQFANIDGDMKLIAFTSPGKQEGKTTTAANMAMSMSGLGKRVVIVDCDFRRPRVHSFFGISNAMGMTDLLLSHGDYRSYVKKVPGTDVDILTAGQIPSNPSEILSSKSMKALVESLKADYDYVIFDTPPAGIVTDAAVMAPIIDGVVMVVYSGKSDTETAVRASEMLASVRANMLGVVLNRLEGLAKGYYEYYSDK